MLHSYKEKRSLPVWREPVISLRRYWANLMISRLHRFLQPLILGNNVSSEESQETFADRGTGFRQQTSEALGSLPARRLAAPAATGAPRAAAGPGRAPQGSGCSALPRGAAPAAVRGRSVEPQPRGGWGGAASLPGHRAHTHGVAASSGNRQAGGEGAAGKS